MQRLESVIMYHWRYLGKRLIFGSHLHKLLLQPSVCHRANNDIILWALELSVIAIAPYKFSPLCICMKTFYSQPSVFKYLKIDGVSVYNRIAAEVLFGPISCGLAIVGSIKTPSEITAIFASVTCRMRNPHVSTMIQIDICHNYHRLKSHNLTSNILRWPFNGLSRLTINSGECTFHFLYSSNCTRHRHIKDIGYFPDTVCTICNLLEVQFPATLPGAKSDCTFVTRLV